VYNLVLMLLQALTMLSHMTPGSGLELGEAKLVEVVTPKSRPPVTQILHQTLTQRQALLKQSNAPSQSEFM